MAVIVITIKDNKYSEVITEAKFVPPISGQYTSAQSIALRILNLIEGNQLIADNSRVISVRYPVESEILQSRQKTIF